MLAGFLDRNEVRGHAHDLMHFKSASEKQTFWAGFERAKALRTQLQAVPPSPAPRRLDPVPYFDEVRAGDMYQSEFEGSGAYLAEVRLDSLVPAQTNVLMEPKRPGSTPVPGDWDGLLRYCLPVETRVDAQVIPRESGFRFLTDRIGIGPNHVRYRLSGGSIEISLQHLNLVHVRRVGGRNIVFNGTHRVVELLAAGHEVAPVLVFDHENPNTVPWLQGPTFWNVPVLMNHRPPLFTDFMSEIAVDCPVSVAPSVIDINVGAVRPAVPQPPQMPPALQMVQQLPNMLKVA